MDFCPESLNKKKVVCINHFADEDFINPATKMRLKRGAIPKPYNYSSEIKPPESVEISDDLHVKTPEKTYERTLTFNFSPQPSTSRENSSPTVSPKSKQWLMDVSDMPEYVATKNTSDNTPRKQKLKRTIAHQRSLIKNKRSILARLRKGERIGKNKVTVQRIICNFNYQSKYSKTLTQMQTLHRKKMRWSKEEKEFALLTFYKSPAAYKFWRNKLGIVFGEIN